METSIEERNEVPLQNVKFLKTWTFWENYQMKEDSQNKGNYGKYIELMKSIFSFDNIIAFWQFWNSYPGNNPGNIFFNGERMIYFFNGTKRIVSIGLFHSSIKPEWEDELNKKGKIFIMEYIIENDIEKFLEQISKAWLKLMLSTIGELYEFSKFINGIRFVDKTKTIITHSQKILFRLEIWVNNQMGEENVNQAKEFLKKEFHCPGITVKDL